MNTLRNPYLLGLYMLVAEGLVNLFFGAPIISGFLISLIAGSLFSVWQKAPLSNTQRLKATIVYTVIVTALSLLISLRTLLSRPEIFVTLISLVALFVLQGILVYLGLLAGSKTYGHSLATQQSSSSMETPSWQYGIGAIFAIGFVLLISVTAADPLTNDPALLEFGGVVFGFCLIALVWAFFKKHWYGVIVGIIILAFVVFCGWTRLFGLLTLTTVDVATAKIALNQAQAVAITCLQKKEDLLVEPRTKLPHIAIECNLEDSWPSLPSGWDYDPVEDANVQDGNFKFSARSRLKQHIVCTENGCIVQ